MATLKEFEEALRQHGMVNALAILEQLKKRDRETRSVAPARRVVGRKMTVELARTVLEMHATTGMTQQEIAFKLGVNQGRVNEVIKRGKWLNGDPTASAVVARDKAIERLTQRSKARREPVARPPRPAPVPAVSRAPLQAAPVERPKDAELPLDRRDVVRLRTPDSALPRPPLRRQPDAPAPIVSAQLAFLDL